MLKDPPEAGIKKQSINQIQQTEWSESEVDIPGRMKRCGRWEEQEIDNSLSNLSKTGKATKGGNEANAINSEKTGNAVMADNFGGTSNTAKALSKRLAILRRLIILS